MLLIKITPFGLKSELQKQKNDNIFE